MRNKFSEHLAKLASKNKNIKQAFIDDANAKIKHYKFDNKL